MAASSAPTESGIKRSSTSTSKSKIPADLVPKRNSPSVHPYLRRITIEGIDTHLRATGKFEKRFWLLVILTGMAGTLVYLIPAFARYFKHATVLAIGHQTSDPDLRLPNTWICRWAMNYTYFHDRFSEIKSRLRHDKRLQLFAKRYTAIWREKFQFRGELTVDAVFNFTLSYIALAPMVDNAAWLRYVQPQLLNEVLYRGIEAMGSDWPGVDKFYKEGFFDCPSVLKKCSLNGFPIDCCRDSLSGHNAQERKCYKIDAGRELLKNPSLIKPGQPIELSIETFADSKYFPWNIVDVPGIIVSFQTHMPSMFDYQVHELAAGTANKFNIKGTRRHKISKCIDRYRYNAKSHIDADPLVQQFFKDFQDPEVYTVAYCATGRLIEAMSIRCGCVPYIDTLKPHDTKICTPAHIYACYYGAFQDTPEMEAIEKDAGGVQQKDIFVDLKGLIASDCAQLCDSWSYDADVFSTIMDGEEGDITTYWRNKVTLIFDPEYRVETEVVKIDYLAFLASIGEGLGLILGMSFITFVQLAVWPAAALCFRRSLRRVGPAMEEDR